MTDGSRSLPVSPVLPADSSPAAVARTRSRATASGIIDIRIDNGEAAS